MCAFGKPLTEQTLAEEAFNFDFRRRVGLLFQDADVQLFSPTVFDEVAFGPAANGLAAGGNHPPRGKRAGRIADRKIEGPRSAPAFGRGETARRHGFGLSLDPAVWLLDEPSAGLDPRSQSWLEDFIIDQVRAGKTMVTATHDLVAGGGCRRPDLRFQ